MIIGLDLGSTSAKAVALAEDGRIAAACKEVYPAAGHRRARQDPEAIWRSALSALRQVVEAVGPAGVQGIALSAAMHTVVPVDERGEAIGDASTWGDAGDALRERAAPTAAAADLYAATGCPPWPLYLPARLPRARERDAALRDRPFGVMTLKEWVFRRLTGHSWMDLVTASSTGLLDIRRGEWAPSALAVAGVEAERLPELVDCTAAAALSAAAGASTGLAETTPVVVGAADGVLVNVALGADRPGDATLSIGTTAAVRLVTAEPWLDPRQRTWCYRFYPGGFLAGGALNNAGLLLDWVRRVLYSDVPAAEGFDKLLGDELREIAPGADGVSMRPFLVDERDPRRLQPSAGFEGLRERHGRAHLARAAVDALALSLAELADVLNASGPDGARFALTGVPADHPQVAQIVCDCLGQPVRVVRLADASAVGAALIACDALGLPRPQVEAASWELKPDPVAARAYADLRAR